MTSGEAPGDEMSLMVERGWRPEGAAAWTAGPLFSLGWADSSSKCNISEREIVAYGERIYAVEAGGAGDDSDAFIAGNSSFEDRLLPGPRPFHDHPRADSQRLAASQAGVSAG